MLKKFFIICQIVLLVMPTLMVNANEITEEAEIEDEKIFEIEYEYFENEEWKFKKEKVKYLIDMINDMDLTNKLRLAICMNDSEWFTLDYEKKEMYNKFDSKLKEIGQEYRTILINFGQSKYFIINFAMSKLMEMEQTDRNKVALYLFNNIKIQ